MKIYSLRNGGLNETDRLELAKLLIKAGYVVRIGKEQKQGRTTTRYFVEFKEVKEDE